VWPAAIGVSAVRKTRFLKAAGPLFSLVLFSVALAVLRHELASYRLRDVFAGIAQMPREHVVLAAALTALSYLVLTSYDTLAVAYVGRKLSYHRIALASFIGYSFTYTVGHTLFTGVPIRYRLYSGWGLSAIEVARIVGFCVLTFWVGFLSTAGLAFLLEPLHIPATLHIPFGSAHVLGSLAALLVVAYVAAAAFQPKPLRLFGWEISWPRLPLALGQVAAGFVDWVLAGGVLYLLLPEKATITFPLFMAMFLLAQIIGQASQVPGGLGVFESVLMLLLTPYAVPAAVLGTLVAYRLIYYVAPLALAAALLVGNEVMQRSETVRRLGAVVSELLPDVIPQVLAVLTFIGGVVLLISGATPTAPSRLVWMRDLVPLPLVETSHFLASLAGAALLLLGWGLQRRLDAAYLLTSMLLGVGIVGSLLKGLDWEEALVLTVFLALLLPARRHFYRRASLTSEPFSAGWAVAVLIVLLGATWLGMFAYRRVDYTDELFWRFAIGSDAPRFLRAMVGAVAVVVFFAMAKLLRAATPRPEPPIAAQLALVRSLVAGSRETYANLALLGDKRFLFSESRKGFLMYDIEGKSWVSMGDPIGPEDDRVELIWAFREMCDRHDDWAAFYLVRPAGLPSYLDLGLTLLKLGEEARVELATFSLAGDKRKAMRNTLNKLERDGFSFEIVQVPEVPTLMPALKEISDAWLAHKNTREKSFSLGSFSTEYLLQFPVALVRSRGRLVAFANLWLGAEHAELSVDLMRHLPETPNGVMDYLFLNLMTWGKEQGYEFFNLGMAPLSGLEDRPLAPFWSRVGARAFRHGEHFYNFQGLRQYKQKFDPVWEPRYVAAPGGLALPRVLANLASLVNRGLKGVVAK
jgi:phosphatidylglycerol lysyltransferase